MMILLMTLSSVSLFSFISYNSLKIKNDINKFSNNINSFQKKHNNTNIKNKSSKRINFKKKNSIAIMNSKKFNSKIPIQLMSKQNRIPRFSFDNVKFLII